MKSKSETIRFMDLVKRCFFFGGLIAAMAFTATGTQFYQINGNPASINSADGGVGYLWSTKPPTKTGLIRPSLTTTPQFDAVAKIVCMVIDSAWPPDDSDYGLAKTHYRISSGNWSHSTPLAAGRTINLPTNPTHEK